MTIKKRFHIIGKGGTAEIDIQWISREDQWFARYAHKGCRSMCPPKNFLRVGDDVRSPQHEALPTPSSASEYNGEEAHIRNEMVTPEAQISNAAFSLEEMD